MTYPRSQLVDAENPGIYHCVSRCVRQAFLCGRDRLSGRNFDHRKDWIESRILELAEYFAVSVYAYTVMSNHLHVVVRIDPQAPVTWTDEEVARRWLHAFPGALCGSDDPQFLNRSILSLTGDEKRLAVIRSRLGSLSWFMRALNEPIARMANREDDCTGRFWEGRFKCQALLDERAALSCMTYVDLNPVRAGLCKTLEQSCHTSVQRRLRNAKRMKDNPNFTHKSLSKPLKPVAGMTVDASLGISESDYLELVQWTGMQARADKRGKLNLVSKQDIVPAALLSVTKHPKQWLRQVQGTESRYYRAIGSAEALMLKAADLGQKWMKGVSSARTLHLLNQQSA